MQSILNSLSKILIIIGIGFIIGLSSCQWKKNAEDKLAAEFSPQFSILLIYENGTMGFLLTDSLWKRSLEIPVPYPEFTREFIQKENVLFHVNPHSNQLIKSKITSSKLQALDSIPIINKNIENFLWKNNTDTLILLNVNKGERDTCWYYEIDTKSLTILKKKELPIPSEIAGFNVLSIGLSQLINKSELWIAYAYSKMEGQHHYSTLDTMYYANIDLQNFLQTKLQKDQRSTYPGGINTVQTYDASLQNGDYYFMSCPGIALGNNPSQPTAIFRKLFGSQEVDPHYMLNISDRIGNHAYGMWQVKDHTVVIRSERKDKFTNFTNHHAVFQFEYYEVDLLKGSFKKLDIPLDKGTRKENVLVRGEKVFFGIDDESQQHQIWEYDLATGKSKPIFSATKKTSYILRLDDLNPPR